MRKRSIPPLARGLGSVTTLRGVFDRLAEAAEALGQAGEAAWQGARQESGRQDGPGPRGHGGSLPFTLGGRPGRAVFGYTVRMGLDGLRAEPFGDLPAEADDAAQPRAAAGRAPIVDVFEEGAEFRILAELPGVAAEDVTCTLSDAASHATLHITTTGEARYAKAIDLPGPVVAGSLVQSCRNGILEVRLRRRDAQGLPDGPA